MEDYGDRDGDGYIEYQRSSPRGLVNQGWKDSVDAIRFRDGSVALAPLALCEVQGYAYAAYRARAMIAAELGQQDVRESCLAKAAALKERFNRDFWIEELGWFAIALDADKRQVDSLTSNIGHCLWSGIVADRHVKAVAERLVSPPMWTGWGIRTLAADELAYDPVSYHCGTVWPHDVALCVAGLAANGHAKEALMVTDGLLGASVHLNARLPEFFCGFDRRDIPTPVPFPTSCSPQAWAAATPLLLLRVMLGIEPDATTRATGQADRPQRRHRHRAHRGALPRAHLRRAHRALRREGDERRLTPPGRAPAEHVAPRRRRRPIRRSSG